MDPTEYLAAIRRESAALARAADGKLTALVPSCPDWTVRDLLFHISEVQRFWAQIVELRIQQREDAFKPDPPPDSDPVEWFRGSTQALLSALGSAEPNTRIWTWAPQQNVGFVFRRQAHEAAIHRVDAELASGEIRPIEPALAADGVDEFFEYMATEPDPPEDLVGRTVRLSSDDGRGDWLATLTSTGVDIGRGTADAHATVMATASDLDLLLWRRIPLASVRTEGDRGLLERFIAWPDLT